MSHSKEVKAGGCLIAAVLILLCGCPAIYQNATQDQVTFSVNEKERVNTANSGKYLVFTDGETFECTDAWFVGKFDSSDMYGRIESGKTYNATVYGWRIPLFSMYRNIISLTEHQDD